MLFFESEWRSFKLPSLLLQGEERGGMHYLDEVEDLLWLPADVAG